MPREDRPEGRSFLVSYRLRNEKQTSFLFYLSLVGAGELPIKTMSGIGIFGVLTLRLLKHGPW